MTEIAVSPEVLRSKYGEIVVLDEKIAAASGSDSAGKRAIANAIASETTDIWTPVAEQVVAHVQTLSGNDLVGTFTALVRALNENFREDVDGILSGLVEERSSDVPQVSDEELEDILKQRKVLSDEYKALRNILEMFGQDVSDIPEPKRMTGSRGPRGPRTLSKYDYSIDGEPRSKTQNSLSSIANTVCKDLNWKTKDLREFLVSQGLDLENPGDTWEYTLPNGKVLSAVKSAEDEDSEGETGETPVDPEDNED